MRDPVLPPSSLPPSLSPPLSLDTETRTEIDTTDHPAHPAPPQPNRAARRGKAHPEVPATTVRYRGSAGHGGPAHGAQGRRINPVRRSG